jgi:hypothetical protein
MPYGINNNRRWYERQTKIMISIYLMLTIKWKMKKNTHFTINALKGISELIFFL